MNRNVLYSPFTFLFTLFLIIALLIAVSILVLGIVSSAFVKLGFSWLHGFMLLFFSLLGSYINIPITTVISHASTPTRDYIKVFGINYKIPFIQNIHKTVIAINLGGAIIPICVSAYLIYKFPGSIILCICSIFIVALITAKMAKPIKGVGIVTPAILPPIIAALSAFVIVTILHSNHTFIFIVAYVGGTIGTLIGADILHLKGISKLGAPVVSIGGAGTFDGVFLAGIIAVLLL